MYCKTCGAQLADEAAICSQCGNSPHEEAKQEEKTIHVPVRDHYKSRAIAGLLQILPCLIGIGGIGRFYLGYTTIGLLQLISVVTCGAGLLWSIIDGIMILNGNIDTDADGRPLS